MNDLLFQSVTREEETVLDTIDLSGQSYTIQKNRFNVLAGYATRCGDTTDFGGGR